MLCSILTLFPGAIQPYLTESILGIAQTSGRLDLELVDFRRFATDRHHTVDDRPFGGGPGMVLMPGPIFDAVEDVERRRGIHHKILLCPRGRKFDQQHARALAGKERILFLCGRYEGIDERVYQLGQWEEVSIGDYVLCGGELAALVCLEAAVRLLPGVLGCAESAVQESFSSEGGQDLDYPHYTRPRTFRGSEVPEILLSGNHQAISRWRAERAAELMRRRNPTGAPDPTTAYPPPKES
jgi:tRNA (guanine37-N1)-methyltransferase